MPECQTREEMFPLTAEVKTRPDSKRGRSQNDLSLIFSPRTALIPVSIQGRTPNNDVTLALSHTNAQRFPVIWKSHPLTRLSDICRTGVGHRRWAQQRTPALSPQTEQRPPSASPLAASAFPTSRLFSATRFARTLPPRRGRSLRRKQGGAGGLSRLRRGIISPACLSCLFCLFCLSGAAPRCSGLAPFLSIAEIVFDSGGGGPYAWRMFF